MVHILQGNAIEVQFTNDITSICFSQDGNTVYAISFTAPTAGEDFVLKSAVATPDTKITLLGYTDTPLDYSMTATGLHIKFPLVPFGKLLYAWTFKLTNLG
jgi:hypothetical protein